MARALLALHKQAPMVLSEEDISAASFMPEVDQIVIAAARFTPCLSNENQKTKRVRKDTPGVRAMIPNNRYGSWPHII
jgi:hypothetical protein